jgi:hypothetical protein
VICLFLFLVPLILVSGPAYAEQEKSDEALKKKYAPILGDYEFDLTDMGGDVQTLNFHINKGDLWVDSGDGDPAICEPGEGAEFEFQAVSSDGQEFEIRFEKDEEGQYAMCHINILSMGIEITGTKIK